MSVFRAISVIHPAKPLPPTCWSLDKTLYLTLSHGFQSPYSLRNRTLVLLGFLALALGARDRESQAVLGADVHLVFSGMGYYYTRIKIFN